MYRTNSRTVERVTQTKCDMECIVKYICIRFTSIYTWQDTNYPAVAKYVIYLEMISSPKIYQRTYLMIIY